MFSPQSVDSIKNLIDDEKIFILHFIFVVLVDVYLLILEKLSLFEAYIVTGDEKILQDLFGVEVILLGLD